MEYNYPLDYHWSTEEIIDVIALYNAVEKAYEVGISKEEFMNSYHKFKLIVDSKSEEKSLDKQDVYKRQANAAPEDIPTSNPSFSANNRDI